MTAGHSLPTRSAARAPWLRHARRALVILPALLAACDLPTVPSRTGERAPYDFALEGTGLVLRWPAGATIRVHAAPGPDEARTELLADAVARGIRVWNDATLYGEYRLESADRVENADVVIGWSDGALPVDTAGCAPGEGGYGVTTFCLHPNDPGRLRPFPIPTPDGPVTGRPRILIVIRASQPPAMVPRVVAHELGHALGIGRHSEDADDLMWGGLLLADAPSPADVATIRVLYRTPPDVTP